MGLRNFRWGLRIFFFLGGGGENFFWREKAAIFPDA